MNKLTLLVLLVFMFTIHISYRERITVRDKITQMYYDEYNYTIYDTLPEYFSDHCVFDDSIECSIKEIYERSQ